jgi:hypothetical protein
LTHATGCGLIAKSLWVIIGESYNKMRYNLVLDGLDAIALIIVGLAVLAWMVIDEKDKHGADFDCWKA